MLHKATPVDASYKYFLGEEPNKQIAFVPCFSLLFVVCTNESAEIKYV